jgi:hypothetical protein
MRATMIVMVCVFASALLFASNGTDTDAGDKKEPAKPPAAENEKPHSIPMDSIYTTSDELGFKKRLRALFVEKDGSEKGVFSYSYDLKMIREASRSMGASNIFLVRGDDITAAVMSTRAVFATGDSADRAPDRNIQQKPIKSEKHWLVVYLGIGWSEPPRWTFKAATIHDRVLEFHYGKVKVKSVSLDNIQYFYWVPLPPLQHGVFEAKLFDVDKGRTTLIRFVDVP